MTALAVNLLALAIVLGLCWAAMVWLGRGFHGHGKQQDDTAFAAASDRKPSWIEDPCEVCNGIGARPGDGRVEPCRECYGTGVLS